MVRFGEASPAPEPGDALLPINERVTVSQAAHYQLAGSRLTRSQMHRHDVVTAKGPGGSARRDPRVGEQPPGPRTVRLGSEAETGQGSTRRHAGLQSGLLMSSFPSANQASELPLNHPTPTARPIAPSCGCQTLKPCRETSSPGHLRLRSTPRIRPLDFVIIQPPQNRNNKRVGWGTGKCRGGYIPWVVKRASRWWP